MTYVAAEVLGHLATMNALRVEVTVGVLVIMTPGRPERGGSLRTRDMTKTDIIREDLTGENLEVNDLS